MGRQKQQLSTKTKILLSFGRKSQSRPNLVILWRTENKSFETIKLRTELSGNDKCPRTLI